MKSDDNEEWAVDLNSIMGLIKYVLLDVLNSHLLSDKELRQEVLNYINKHKGNPVVIKEYNS